MAKRFLLLADVCEILNISSTQAYALVRSGDLPAIKIGGRGQWRVESTELEAYVQRKYTETRDFVRSHPYSPGDSDHPSEDLPTMSGAPGDHPAGPDLGTDVVTRGSATTPVDQA